MASMIEMTPAAIAVNRFGLGAKPNEAAPQDPKQWLLSQFDAYQPLSSAWRQHKHTGALVSAFAKTRQNKMADKKEKKAKRKIFNRAVRANYESAVQMRTQSALLSTTPFVERLVHFWANHFAVSTEKADVAHFAAALELDAIRPHVLGNFKDMLMAVEKHPAMLLYLNQVNSIGPESKMGLRVNKRKPGRKRGLNENLAREIMELHTLGVRSGYTQTDVTELARALTGWGVQGGRQGKNVIKEANGFMFNLQIHEPGTRTILQRRYSQADLGQAEAVLMDLAISSSTAKHIATKLARHFVADNPPRALVDRLSRAFIHSQGDLSRVYRVLINAPEAWHNAPVKFKTPWEWLVSVLRATGQKNLNGVKGRVGADAKKNNKKSSKKISAIMQQLGQPIWKPGSPAGYDDISASWLSPNALLRRVELAQRLAKILGSKLDSRVLARQVLLNSISSETQTAIARSESAASGLALLFVSPEFLRR